MRPTPLVAPVRVERRGELAAGSTFTLDPGEPLLAGHYPGFPILPGVCLVEFAHRTAVGAIGDPGARLTAVESTRFLGPVRPGDTVHTEAGAEAVEGGWRCRADLTASRAGVEGRRKVATVRLRYGTVLPTSAAAAAGPPEGAGAPDGSGAPDGAAPPADAGAPAAGAPAGSGAPALSPTGPERSGALDVVGVKALLPHRFPMLLVDAVLAATPGESVVATKAVTVNEPCYAAGGPDTGYPPTLLVESWCQAAALLACLDAPNPDVLTGQVALFGGISGLRFGAPIHPGSLVVHRARLVKLFDRAAVLTGTAEVAGRTVLEVDNVTIAFRDAAALAPA
jgi:3-hydroxyacyl-[acyl-carrier-protein] dehydratase